MYGFGRNLLSGSPFLFWALAPFLILGALVFTLPLEYEDGFQLLAVVVCDLTLLLLAASLWPYSRVSPVRRTLMGWVATLFTLYALDAWFPHLFPSKGSPSERWRALAGFLVVGLPCWEYALLGRFSLAPEPISMPPDEPLLREAYDRARAELPRLLAAFPDGCPEGAFLRFPFTTTSDEIEHLWGQILTLNPTHAEVVVLTQPITQDEPLDELTIDLADVEDFEFEDPTGRPVGGFTTRAMVAYADREGLAVPRYIRRSLERDATVAQARTIHE